MIRPMRLVVSTLVILGCGAPGALDANDQRAPPAPPLVVELPPAPITTTSVAAEEPPAPADVTEEDSDCLRYMFMILYSPAQPSEPFDAAERAYERASAASEQRRDVEAGRAFMDCAKAYRAVPAGHPDRERAEENARICYYDAIHAFANGRRLRDGVAALKKAAEEDPPMREAIEKLLADPPVECE